MHKVLNRLGGLSLSKKNVVRLTDRPDKTIAVYHGRKTTTQQQQLINISKIILKSCKVCMLQVSQIEKKKLKLSSHQRFFCLNQPFEEINLHSNCCKNRYNLLYKLFCRQLTMQVCLCHVQEEIITIIACVTVFAPFSAPAPISAPCRFFFGEKYNKRPFSNQVNIRKMTYR